jgi:hypothetical protein
MVAQQMVRDRPSIFRRMILVGTAPRGGEDIMHLDKPSLARHLGDPTLKGYAVLQFSSAFIFNFRPTFVDITSIPCSLGSYRVNCK